MKKPRLLDPFCGAGGAAVGYARAGFDVTAFDIAVQPHYPLMSIQQADAMDVLADVEYCRGFDVIHASPPCQAYSSLRTLSDNTHPQLIAPVRELLRAIGKPYVIENVVGAPLLDPVILCGSMFGLGFQGRILKRHRLFESSIPLVAPADTCRNRPVVGVYGTGGAWTRIAPGGGGVKVSRRRRCTRAGHRLDRLSARAGAGYPACLHRVHRDATTGPPRTGSCDRMTPGQHQATDDILESLSVWTMSDVGPVLTCLEVESLAGFLVAFGMTDQAQELEAAHESACPVGGLA